MRLLLERDQQLDYIENLTERTFAKGTLTPQDRAFVQELVYGVCRHQATLDFMISRKTQGRTQKDGLRALLRLGLYQIFWMTRMAPHAAVHETVELAKEMGFGPQAGFINAVLRGYLRERDETSKVLESLKQTDPALALSHPEWLYAQWALRWGKESAVKLMEWDNRPPATFARVNRLKVQPGELAERWQTEGVEATLRNFDWAPEGDVYELIKRPALTQLQTFRDGLFYVQDPSTLLAVHVLAPLPGERVLDFCAAPGGKSTYIAQKMSDQGEVLAHDPDPARLRLVTENIQRLGLKSVQITSDRGLVSSQKFDRILLDAPCSNTGVARRRVDLRWRLQASEIQRLAATQGELLNYLAPLVKPGGVLVYSTCSIEPQENSEVIQAFLDRSREFRLELERDLLPFRDGVDGAYVALLRRQS